MASNITPGTQQYCEVASPTGLAGSCTQDVLSPVEYGRTAAKSAYTTTASNGANLPDYTPPAADTTSGGGGSDTVY